MRRTWSWPWELRRRGVLGINRRNLELLSPLNPRRLYPRVDDKIVTKALCEGRGIPVPETFAVIERCGDVRRFGDLTAGRTEFVVKPARGSGGEGILVVTGRDGADLVASNGRRWSPSELRYHLASILAGLYSLGARPDRAIIEQRIRPHTVFADLAVGGTPDVRIICHCGEPVVAMLRLPTRGSDGRANLHQGAVGAGVELATGRTTGGVLLNRAVAAHPDTGAAIGGREVPHWPALLDVARRLSRALELGYVGIDQVLDEGRGPVVLEANARPGLAIQVANRRGLHRELATLSCARSTFPRQREEAR
jgi:alpha-L-glutamate ligase-like protein